jgi:hypothetical protein
MTNITPPDASDIAYSTNNAERTETHNGQPGGVSNSLLEDTASDVQKSGSISNAEHPKKPSNFIWASLIAVGRWVWTLEALNNLVGIGCLAAICGILSRYDGKSLKTWPYNFTINTALSLLVTVLKATLAATVAESISQLKWIWFKRNRKLKDMAAIDAASRGPWGALKLIVTPHTW